VRVLLTGASSFTGYWFAKSLSEAGHVVVAPLRSSLSSYTEGVRAERVRLLQAVAQIVPECVFGEERFLTLIKEQPFDAFGHHAAQVGNYRSPDFDVCGAVSANTLNLRSCLEVMKSNGLKAAVITGSVFEADEGVGEFPLKAFSPYGLSKGLTAHIFKYFCEDLSIAHGKFVIPNPFGPYEEPRFCAYLVKTWKSGQTAIVKTPEYVRDNIHVDLLSRAYTLFLEQKLGGLSLERLSPSGYVESQGAFARRFASEFASRCGLGCEVECPPQIDFSEPAVRVNTTNANKLVVSWDEDSSWDSIKEYYFRQG
jgi:UDP-glucose 4-epimerase